ncbi:KTSC domain-containing protein [Herbidospora galbida]|uniref:KTSC domain-containing protein n=1 Tax=Herbidospora galbida TaxID=2575442 RepID=A0A4U3MA88_9ACTN|nr:KTSC domain-containing protein [Herbidospora galbida]TKK84577.1 KTSC domain-containing protein [Herbidospora galbida]
MAPKRPNVPSWDDIAGRDSGQGENFASSVLDKDYDNGKNYGPEKRTFRRRRRDLRPDPFWYLDEARDPWLRRQLQDASDGSDIDLLPYQPTATTNHERPRTKAAGYNQRTRQLRVRFRNGSRYVYFDVEPEIWEEFKATHSPGEFLDSEVIPFYAYEQETAPTHPDRQYKSMRKKPART